MVRVGAAVIAGSVALLGFDSGTEALASIIVIWRFTGTRLTQRHLRAPRATAGRGQLLPARPLHRQPGPLSQRRHAEDCHRAAVQHHPVADTLCGEEPPPSLLAHGRLPGPGHL